MLQKGTKEEDKASCDERLIDCRTANRSPANSSSQPGPPDRHRQPVLASDDQWSPCLLFLPLFPTQFVFKVDIRNFLRALLGVF